jgi:hypothetical protein
MYFPKPWPDGTKIDDFISYAEDSRQLAIWMGEDEH